MKVRPYWSDLVSDIKSTIKEYEIEGYEGTVLQVGPVSVLEPEAINGVPGLSVLLPKSEFEKIKSLNESYTMDAADVYAAAVKDLVLLGIVLRFESQSAVIGLPAYYDQQYIEQITGKSQSTNRLDIHLRTLSNERIIISCTDPRRFVPQIE